MRRAVAADGLEIFLRDELASWSATYMYQPSGNASGRGGEREFNVSVKMRNKRVNMSRVGVREGVSEKRTGREESRCKWRPRRPGGQVEGKQSYVKKNLD